MRSPPPEASTDTATRSAMDFTRSSILKRLREEPCTVATLIDELGISGTAVRKQIDQLRIDGLIHETGLSRGARGRPATVYGLTEEGEALFRYDRAEILESVLDAAHEVASGEDLQRILRAAGRRLARQVMAKENSLHGRPPEERPGDSPEDRVEYAFRLLRRFGGRDARRATLNDAETLELACPLGEYVGAYPGACQIVAGFTEEVLGSPVEPRCSERRGRYAHAEGLQSPEEAEGTGASTPHHAATCVLETRPASDQRQ